VREPRGSLTKIHFNPGAKRCIRGSHLKSATNWQARGGQAVLKFTPDHSNVVDNRQ
jgi:hypothetical protein